MQMTRVMAGVIGVVVACTRAPELLEPPEPVAISATPPDLIGPPARAPARATKDEIPATLAPSTIADVEVLLDADVFALGGVGYTGEPPVALLAAERLVAQPDAIAAFDWVVVNGSAAGRLYGYWGLFTLDPARAAARASAMSADTDVVSTMSGCLISSGTVGDVAAPAHWPRLRANAHQPGSWPGSRP